MVCKRSDAPAGFSWIVDFSSVLLMDVRCCGFTRSRESEPERSSAMLAVMFVPGTVVRLTLPEGSVILSSPKSSTMSVCDSVTVPVNMPPRIATVAAGVLNVIGRFLEILPPTNRKTPFEILIVISPTPVVGS